MEFIMSRTQPKKETEVIETLQKQLANAFTLYANYKKYHWLTYGPLFRDLHLLFDDHATGVLGTIDEFGERIRILGGIPQADIRRFAERGSVSVSASEQTPKLMIEEAVANHRIVIDEMRKAVDVAQDAGDPGTADLFTRIVQIHEKQEWFLREVLVKNDGLVS